MLTIIAGVILSIYLVMIGKQPSISESVYSSKWGILFYPVLIAVTTLLMIDANNLFIFLAGGCIWYAAGANKFKEDITSTVHYFGAVMGYIIAMAYIICCIFWLLPVMWVIFSLLVLALNLGNRIYLIEVVGFYIIIISLLIK